MPNRQSFATGLARGLGRSVQSIPYFLRQVQDRRRQELYDVQIRQRIEEGRRRMEAEEAEITAEREREQTLDLSGWTSLSVRNQMAFLTPGGMPRETAMEMAEKIRGADAELAGRIVGAAAPYEGARMAAGPVADPFQQARQKAAVQAQAATGDRDAWMGMSPEEQKAALQFQDSEKKRVDLERAQVELAKAKEPEKEKPAKPSAREIYTWGQAEDDARARYQTLEYRGEIDYSIPADEWIERKKGELFRINNPTDAGEGGGITDEELKGFLKKK